MTREDVASQLATIMLLGVGAQWAASRIKAPAIILLLLAGLAAGPGAKLISGHPLIETERLFGDLLIPGVGLAVAIILYEGGLSLRLHHLREVGSTLGRLVTLGALVSWLLAAGASWALGLFDLKLSLLLGALLVVTGPTVIRPLLRQVRPQGKVGPLLDAEGIVIDPIGASLALLVYEAVFITADPALGTGLFHVVQGFFLTAVVGVGVGLLGAAAVVIPFRRHWLPDHLENALSLMVLLVTAAGADLLQAEAGLLAATVMGFVVGNALQEEARPILDFKENLQILLISGLFVLLAAKLEVEQAMAALTWQTGVFLVLLIVVVRPLSVAVATIGSPLSWSERVFAASLAPRGIVAAAVASVFALGLRELGVADSERLLPTVFAVIIVTVMVYGLGAPLVALALRLAEANPQGVLILGATPLGRAIGRALVEAGITVRLVDKNYQNVRTAHMAGLEATFANPLSHTASDELNLTGIGHFVALTPNAAVNTLAADHFLPDFGRAKTFQLTPPETTSPWKADESPQHPRARYLFADGSDFDELNHRLTEEGFRIAATPLTEAFGLAQWREQHGLQAVPMFSVSAGKLGVFTTDRRPTLRPGDLLIGLVPPREPSLEGPALPSGVAVPSFRKDGSGERPRPDAALVEGASGGEA